MVRCAPHISSDFVSRFMASTNVLRATVSKNISVVHLPRYYYSAIFLTASSPGVFLSPPLAWRLWPDGKSRRLAGKRPPACRLAEDPVHLIGHRAATFVTYHRSMTKECMTYTFPIYDSPGPSAFAIFEENHDLTILHLNMAASSIAFARQPRRCTVIDTLSANELRLIIAAQVVSGTDR